MSEVGELHSRTCVWAREVTKRDYFLGKGLVMISGIREKMSERMPSSPEGDSDPAVQ